MNFLSKDYDTQTLYPVQGKRAKIEPRFEPYFDEREEDQDGDIVDQLPKINGFMLPNSQKRRAASLAISQRASSIPSTPRRVSTDSKGDRKVSISAGIRKLSTVPPPSSVAGPNGRRVSPRIDYGFYDHHVSKRSSLIGPIDDEKSKGRGRVDKVIEALKHVRLRGLREFAHSTSWRARLFWFLLFTVCMTFLILEIKKAKDNYYEKPLTTTFRIKTPNSIPFPQVYICFGNALNRTYVRSHPEAVAGIDDVYKNLLVKQKRRKRSSESDGIDPSSISNDEALRILQGNDDMTMPWDEEGTMAEEYVSPWGEREHQLPFWDQQIDRMESFKRYMETYEQLNRHKRSALNSSNSSDQSVLEKWKNDGDVSYNFLLEAGFKVNETFLDCSFRGFDNRKYNCNEIIKTVMDMNYYTCYIVNLPKDTHQVVAKRGLQFLINSQVSLYPLVRENDTKPNGYAGLFVSVSDNYDPTNWYKGVVTAGTYTKLSLAATHVKLLNTARGAEPQKCIENGTELYHVFKSNYSRTACQMDCFWYAVVKHCHCIMHIDKNFIKDEVMNKTPLCSFRQKEACIGRNVTNSTKAQNEMNKCTKRCIAPCDSTRYEMVGSSSPLNPGSFPGKVPVKDLIKLDISFGRLEVAELFQSQSKSISQTVADIGGQINLWIGASMITLLEIPIFVVVYCVYRSYQKIVDWVWGERIFNC